MNFSTIRFITAIAVAYALSAFSTSAATPEEVWPKILISYNWDNDFWGYDMGEQTYTPVSDYWKDWNWEIDGENFTLRSGEQYAGQDLGTWRYDQIPWTSKIDDTHIAIHNLFRNYHGLFEIDSSIDLFLVGEINFDAMTITINPQEYADGYIFAACPEDNNNDYSFSELQPVVLTIYPMDWGTRIWTDGMSGSSENAFAFYKKNSEVEGENYSASIGMCGMVITGKHEVVSYSLQPVRSNVLPSNNPITEIQSVDLDFGTIKIYENPNITEAITVKRGETPLDIEVIGYVSRDNEYHYIIEPAASLTEAGTYTFTIPKGLIGDRNYADNNFTNGEANPELTLSFTIVDVEQLEYDFNYTSVEPKPETMVDRLTEVKITYPSAVSINDAYVGNISCNKSVIESVLPDVNDPNSIIISLRYEIVEEGDVTFSFPQGVFGDEKYGQEFMFGHANPAFELKYSVTGKYQMFYDMGYSSITPTPNETYDELAEFRVTFEEPIVINQNVAKTSFLYKDSGQISNPFKSFAVDENDDKTLVVTLNKTFVEAGLYDFTIARGTVGDATYGIDYTYGHANKEFGFRYTISGKSGVDDIAVDRENGDEEYFSLQGIKVNKENLTPGIYIRKSGKKTEKVWIR